MRFFKKTFFLFCFVSVVCQSFGEEQDEAVFKGIILFNRSQDITSLEKKEGIHLFDLQLSKREQKWLEEILSRHFLNKPINEKSLEKLKERIVLFYQKLGRPFIIVYFPLQKIHNEILLVRIDESKVSKVQITGNEKFGDKNYEKNIHVKPGDLISTDILGADIAWINRNPFRRAEVVYKPGEKDYTTDVDIIIKDKKPIKMYAGTNNTGFKETGYQRSFAGIYLGNIFTLDQILSYQYTADYDFKRFQSHTFFYEIPFPWKNSLTVFGGLSFVDTKLEIDRNFNTKGKSYQISARYCAPFNLGKSYPQEIRFGFDYKRTNNTLVFGGVTVSKQNVNLLQFLLEYRVSRNFGYVDNDFSLELVGSPGRTLPQMHKTQFSVLRTNTDAYYFYVRGAFRQVYKLLKGFRIKFDVLGQVTTKRLLPSEQFGLGGYDTVRGYQERAVNADSAILARFEPRFPMLKLQKHRENGFVFYVFTDFAVGWNQLKIAEGMHMTEKLLGVGPGMNYFFDDKIMMRLDWGYEVLKIANDHSGRNRFNFGAMISF